MVAPFMGAWIETAYSMSDASYTMSHPSWVRGLKRQWADGLCQEKCRTLHGCVD